MADSDTPPTSPAPPATKHPNVLFTIEFAGHNGTPPATVVHCIKVLSKSSEELHVEQTDGATDEESSDGPVSKILRVIIAIDYNYLCIIYIKSYQNLCIFLQRPYYASNGLAANVQMGNPGDQPTLCLAGVTENDIVHPPRNGI